MPFHMLVVDDHESFRKFVCQEFGKRPEFSVISEAADGEQAVQKAEALKPEIVLLDINLPGISGFEVARRIRRSCPNTKILFLSQESSAEIIGEALQLGAQGYVVKRRAGIDLVAAVDAILQGGQFVSEGFGDHALALENSRIALSGSGVETFVGENDAGHHEVEFYSDEPALLKSLVGFVSKSLSAGHKTVILATQAHREALLHYLQGHQIEFASAVEEGRFLSLDASEALSDFMERSGPNRERFLTTFSKRFQTGAASGKGKGNKIAVFGEMVAVLCAEGKPLHALQLESFWNELLEKQAFILRCAYPGSLKLDRNLYARICAEHHGGELDAH
jgi:DNA-binding response OmpR family regulator